VMQAEQRLIEADHRKNEFLAVLAHELRNPLAPIGNMLNVLRVQKLSAIEGPLGVMERQLAQMVRLVDDLLDISRISQGKIELRVESVELAKAVDQAIETVVPLREAMNHRITLSLPPEPVHVRADPARLAQIIGNLLHNACKFSDAGSEIQLIVTAGESRTTIRVRDQGIGIGPDQIGRVFDPFMQAGSSLGRSGSGIGIGLTLVKNLVELHGGDIAVHSAGLGRGSEFVVRLPLETKVATDGAAPAQVPDKDSGTDLGKAPGSTASAGSLRILVVDDNRDSAESMSVLLELHGHQTRSADDGIEALAMIEEWQPQVVLLDIGLPGIDGYEVARRLRARPDQAALHLIALTGWGQEEDRRKSAEAGFDGHLVKPADYGALAGMLADVRSARSAPRDASHAAANTHG
jgi:CheY-like chemotaxis protein